MVCPDIVGAKHTDTASSDFLPFAIGQIDPGKGFVHVLDDVTLNIVMTELDTITDFVRYLVEKERFLTSGMLGSAPGEEDLLAYYMTNMVCGERHGFDPPRPCDGIYVEEGFWREYKSGGAYKRKKAADQISYAWDYLIQDFSHHVLHGTIKASSANTIADHDMMLRYMARESRLSRRCLAEALVDRVKTAVNAPVAFRTVISNLMPDTAYVFMCSERNSIDDTTGRSARSKVLECYCFVFAWKHRQYRTVIGIATEPGLERPQHSHDLVIVRDVTWDAEAEAEAKYLQQSLGILRDENIRIDRVHDNEYPRAERSIQTKAKKHRTRSMRNSKCPCGSGRKFKICCGSR